MSSTVRMDMVLISSSNIIPSSQLKAVFEECVEELGGVIKDKELIIGKEHLGSLTINDCIILSFASDYETSKRLEMRKLLRDTFTRRVSIVHENYLYELDKRKKKLEQEKLVERELLESINRDIEKTNAAFERQQLDECEALKAEIVDAAVAQGYEVVEEKNSNGIQLQFIRREY